MWSNINYLGVGGMQLSRGREGNVMGVSWLEIIHYLQHQSQSLDVERIHCYQLAASQLQ